MSKKPQKATFYLGASFRVYGEKRLTAILPLGRGRGRARASAPNTADGRERLRSWVRSTLATAATSARSLTPAEAADAIAALDLLPSGVSLADAARHYLATTAAADPAATIGSALADYLPSLSSSGRRPRTLTTARFRLRCLSALSDLHPDAITPAQAETLCRPPGSPTTQNGVRSSLSAFWEWMKKRRLASSNPFADVPRVLLDDVPPAAYPPAAVAALFAAAEERRPDLIPALAVSFFGGVRTSALARMTGADLLGGSLRVPGPADKKRRGYLVPQHPTLSAWLAAYPAPPDAPLCPLNPQTFMRQRAKLYRAAKIDPIDNGARHSFATYFLAATQDPARTQAALGHYGPFDVLLNHYRALATTGSAADYFAIRPKKPVANLLHTPPPIVPEKNHNPLEENN